MYRIVLFFLITVFWAVSSSAAPDYYPAFAGPLPGKTVNSNSYVDKAVKNFPQLVTTNNKVFHLVSHGRPGELLLNGQWRNAKQVAAFLRPLAGSKGIVSGDRQASDAITHLYIYGCEFGKGEKGRAAVLYLEKTLGIPVSASDDITGKDGDWELEVGTPVIAGSFKGYNGNLQYGPTDDFDNDGIQNRYDIDDDNDGVPDAMESPSCFYTAAEWNTMAKPGSSVTISSALTTTTANFSQLLDGISNVTAVTFSGSPAQAIQNVNVYLFTFASPVHLDALYLKFNTATQFASTTKIQGSNTNNGTDWADLSASVAQTATTNTTVNGSVSVTTSIKYPVTLNTTTAYKYIRITGVAASNIVAQNASEVYFDFNTAAYVASLYPKSTCTDANTDGDNILPQFDLDSDGDGCSDAYEAGATSSLAANFQFTGTDANANGLVDSKENGTTGFINYTSTYSLYATTAVFKSCADSDGDGIFDITDLDDDNDGIPDKTECPSLTTNLASNGGFSVDASALPNWYMGLASATLPIAEPFTPSVITISNNGSPYNYGIGGGNQGNSTLTGGLFGLYDNVNTANGLQYILQEQDPIHPVVVQLSTPLIAGATYGYAFDLGNRVAGSANKYIVALYNNDTKMPEKILEIGVLNTLPAYNATPSYKNFSGSFVPAASGSYSLLFYPSVSGGGSDDFAIDRVAVAGSSTNACDTDGDGIPNHLDLDSDGDGCPDLKEAGVSPATDVSTPASTTNNAGSSYGIIASGLPGSQLNPAATDVNNDGLNDSVDPDTNGHTNYTSTYLLYATSSSLNSCIDTDGDGIVDVIDIDDDNDGITDAQEQTCVNADYNSDSGSGINNIFSKHGIVNGNVLFDQLADDIGLIFSGSSAFNAGVLINSACSEPAIFAGSSWGTDMWFKSVNPFNITQAVPLKSISFKADCAGSNEYLTYTAYGINGEFLYTYNIAANQPHSSNQVIDLVMDPAYNVYSISVTRTANAAVVVGVKLKEGFGVILCDQDIDTDNDGIPNRLDLDSDGDGCSDLKESGVSPLTDVITPSTTNNAGTSYGISFADIGNSQLNPAATDTNNDGLNDSVDPDLNGQTNYASTYTLYALVKSWNFCNDKDGDGIRDLDDIDDDNDGILDAVESPACFYTSAEITIPSSVSTQIPTTGTIANVYDNNTATTFAFTSTTAANAQNKTIFEITPVSPVLASAIVINYSVATGNALGTAVNSVRIEGWNGALWVSLATLTPAAASANMQTLAIPTGSQATYQKYRLYDVNAAISTAAIREVTLSVPAFYVASAHPKVTCNNDTDGDGILNHQDLDSDGDGCSDASETGITGTLLPAMMVNNAGTVYSPAAIAQGPYGINGFANLLETSTSPESGVYTGSYANYSNATNSSIHSCPVQPQTKPDVNVGYVNQLIEGNVSVNDVVPSGSTYGPVATVPGNTNPGTEMPVVNSNGSYTFTAATKGIYQFYVSVCPPSVSVGCQQVLLTIEVLDAYVQTNKPVAAPDFATIKMNQTVTLKTLANDRSGNNYTTIQPSSVSIVSLPKNGTATVNTTTGDITYTPVTGFTGQDTLTYSVCDDVSPSPNCNTSYQIITVLPSSAFNSVVASDDYLFVPQGTTGNGNVLTNDYDPDGNTITVEPQNISVPGKGTFILQADGSYTFETESSFAGAVNFPYKINDNGSPTASAWATIYILVPSVGALPLDLLAFTVVKENGNTAGLNWTTTNEINSSHFVIERMVNGSGQWQAIGIVNTTGNGSSSVNNYYFKDAQPASGVNYYRLKQVDEDNKYKYSPVRLVSFGGIVSLSVYPNPADDYAIIQGQGLLPGNIHIYDALGQQVDGMIRAEQVSPQQLKVQLHRLTPGMYIIKVNGHAIKLIKR